MIKWIKDWWWRYKHVGKVPSVYIHSIKRWPGGHVPFPLGAVFFLEELMNGSEHYKEYIMVHLDIVQKRNNHVATEKDEDQAADAMEELWWKLTDKEQREIEERFR